MIKNFIFDIDGTLIDCKWLQSSEGMKVPQGPSIWICGDCHLGNLGPIVNAKGDNDIQIRDLDQTVSAILLPYVDEKKS